MPRMPASLGRATLKALLEAMAAACADCLGAPKRNAARAHDILRHEFEHHAQKLAELAESRRPKRRLEVPPKVPLVDPAASAAGSAEVTKVLVSVWKEVEAANGFEPLNGGFADLVGSLERVRTSTNE